MPKYLVNVSYTVEGSKGLRKDGGTKRLEVAQKTLQGLGGKLESFYFCLGQYSVVAIVELPDAKSLAAFSLAVSVAGGAECASTELLTPADMDHACSRKTAYKGPGA